jgi:hypothetical protein
MKGEMDPFFFLTKHKNFIPHEYPCRTQFGLERRGKRPRSLRSRDGPRLAALRLAACRSVGFLVPPDRDRHLGETSIEARTSGGEGRLRLRTCGGAVLFINGQEAGWMAPYGRNLGIDRRIQVALKAGRNDIRIWFDDLAERDARYYFQLDYLAARRRHACRYRSVKPSRGRAGGGARRLCVSSTRPMTIRRWRWSPTSRCRPTRP